MTRGTLLLIALATIALATSAAGGGTVLAARPAPRVLVGVTAVGGLCPKAACRWSGRITTITISATGRRSRPITPAERRALLAAIAVIRPASLPPFTGTCPIAYDGQERIYRFSGIPVLRSCTVDLRGVRAVTLAERLLASLPAR